MNTPTNRSRAPLLSIPLAVMALGATLSCPTSAHAQPTTLPTLHGPCPIISLPLARLSATAHDGSTRWLEVADGTASPVYAFPGGSPVGSQITYTIRYCGGAEYALTVARVGTDLAVEVYDAGGAPKITLSAPKGSSITLTNGTNRTVGTQFSPFVVRNSVVANNDMDALLLVDAQVLGSLPVPDKGFGALTPANATAYRIDVWTQLVANYETLYDTFRFRWYLGDLSSADRTSMKQIVSDYVINGDALLIHNAVGIVPQSEEGIMDDAYGINHVVAIDTIDETQGWYGGFWNGHRYLMRDSEAYLAAAGNTYTPPFGRVPAWQPADGVPAEYNASGSVGDAIPARLYAARVCSEFPNPTDETDPDATAGLYGFTLTWHGDVHRQAVGGADDPLFYPWHTTVDTVWSNWLQCQIN